MLINVYSTHRNPPALTFPHELNNRRDLSDPELPDHLNGFIGYIMQGGEREMTQSLYHVMRHIQRVRHHLSLEVEDDALDAFSKWAWEANAICFLPDGSVRDPSGEVLVDPETGEPDEEAQIPYPLDAIDRRERNSGFLDSKSIEVYRQLPPVVGNVEVLLRTPQAVARRAIALALVAVRAESLASKQELSVEELREKLRIGYESTSPNEQAFLDADEPEQQSIINFAWRYEALYVLEWALGLVDDLPFPDAICDVPLTARVIFKPDREELVAKAQLRPTTEILDALDLHFRIHWAVRQARQQQQEPPEGIEPGVVQERHYALNWLVQFEDADWDDVDTPT